jgi:hypothetical protein
MSDGPKVYSKRKGATPPPSEAVYVGRPTKYGNPYIVGKDGIQGACVELYKEWIENPEQQDLKKDIEENLKGKDLICWCKPLACHADVILEIANGQ